MIMTLIMTRSGKATMSRRTVVWTLMLLRCNSRASLFAAVIQCPAVHYSIQIHAHSKCTRFIHIYALSKRILYMQLHRTALINNCNNVTIWLREVIHSRQFHLPMLRLCRIPSLWDPLSLYHSFSASVRISFSDVLLRLDALFWRQSTPTCLCMAPAPRQAGLTTLVAGNKGIKTKMKDAKFDQAVSQIHNALI